LRLVAGFALSAACFTLLVKTLWPYYFFGVFVFASIFFFARYSLSQRRAWLALPPLYVCLLGLLAEVGVSSATPNLLVSLESLAMFLLLLAGCLGVIWVAHRPTSRLAPVPKTAGRSRPL
jgi:ABC-type Fe3+-siderophore transport system permease subunit